MPDQPWNNKVQRKSLEEESPYHAENDWNEKIRGFLGASEKSDAPAANAKSRVIKKMYDSEQ